MPMSQDFEERLFPKLPKIKDYFGTPFHIFDEKGIIDNGNNLKQSFCDVKGFKEYYAVKALPTPAILQIMKKLRFGLDCASPSELILARKNGFRGEEIMFSSNNTTKEIFEASAADGGCILNIDDISMIGKVKEFPELICFRYNPGERRTGNELIGIPVEAKYGLRHDQVIPAYRAAIKRGAKRFGLHSMIISNERNYQYMVETVRMLLELMDELDVTPERTLMVGDTTHDLQMAINAGVDAVGVTHGAHPEDQLRELKPVALLNDFIELRAWFKANA